MYPLEGKVAIVTGAGNGIGRSEARALAAAGAAVVVNDLDRSVADAVVAEIIHAGGRAVASYDDVSQWGSGLAMVELSLKEFDRLDIVVSNAGVNRRGAIIDVTEADLDLLTSVLFKGPFSLVHHAARHWKRAYDGGDRAHRTIVITSSSAGVPGGVRDYSVYGSMKAGVATLALSSAVELRSIGVTVNAILPHAASMMDSVAKGQDTVAKYDVSDHHPMNPQHVANVVTYLASEQAAWFTGQVFEVTGTNVRRWAPWAPIAEVEQDDQWTTDALNDALAIGVFGTLPGSRVIPVKKSGRA